ncbi:MAG TPA: 3-oxoacid CoA-transferase subunit A [Candidatus Dormibacteraeota bacterium]|jgi:3-oxoadipate CoA-transferase alpha subunit
MIDKVVRSTDEAVAGVKDGDVVLVGGFGNSGVPMALIDALARLGRRNLTIVSNNCGTGETGLALLFKHRMVARACASFPAQAGNHHFAAAYQAGECALELIPQGTLAERLRAAASGLGGFFTPTAAGTDLAAGKETREIDGRTYVLERPLRGDVALVVAHRGDRFGNLRHRLASRNFNPVMAMAATLTIAQVEEVVPPGALDPDDVHTPGIFVDRVVQVGVQT